MAVRYYLCDVLGDGSIDDPFRASVSDLLTPSPDWSIHDCRVDSTQAAGEMMAWADVTEQQHAICAAAEGVTFVPFEDGDGNPLTLTDPIGEIQTAKRTAIQNALESRHVPLQGIQLTDEIYVILQRYFLRCRIRQYLVEHDYTELLGDPVSSIPAQKRQAIVTKLEAQGFDFVGIGGGTTIREALRLLIIQDNVAF